MTTNYIQKLKNLNLLFLDDDISISADVYALFTPIFKSVHLAHDINAAMDIYQTDVVNIIISDLELKKNKCALSFLTSIRELDHEIPIIILSAFTKQEYLLTAANLRIDGYLVKPLNFSKLYNVLENVIDRIKTKRATVYITNNIHYDFSQKSLTVNNQIMPMGNKERTLLEVLLNNQNRVVTKEQIMSVVWGSGTVSESAIKSLLSELRKKLQYNVIANIPKIGWMIKIDE